MSLRSFVCAAALVAASFGTAQAASFSFTGNFTNDNDVALFNFTVGASSTVTLKTYSYAGGTMADGTVIAAGGFDPILALFDGAGNFIDDNDDGTSPDVGIDPVTGAEFDTFFQATLGAGNYTVAVSQFNNFRLGDLADGFTHDGPGNETFTSIYGCSNGSFCDVSSDNRTNAWAFDVLGVDVATGPGPSAVPLPAGLPLLLAGLGGFAALSRRKRQG